MAIGFRAKKANGKYKYYWLYRVLFGVPATNLATKGDSISFQTPTIEGTLFRRNKLDGKANHPWKAEVTENATNAEVIKNWYKEVYEPNYADTEGGSASKQSSGTDTPGEQTNATQGNTGSDSGNSDEQQSSGGSGR